MKQNPPTTPVVNYDVIAISMAVVGLLSVAACSACFGGDLAATLVSAASNGA